jgi:hypothetical protein
MGVAGQMKLSRFLEKKSMRKLIIVLVLFGLVSVSNATYVETFSSSNAEWEAARVSDNGAQAYPEAIYNSDGGNSGGYISSSLSLDQPRLYTLDSSYQTSLWGDMTGQALTADFKIDGTVIGPAGAKVRLYVGSYTGGNNYFVTNDTYSWNPNSDTSWTTHMVALLAANFIEWPNQASYNKTFAQVIAAPQDMGLVFSGNFTSNTTLGFTGKGTLMLDNFGTVTIGTIPEPATICLLGIGALSLLRKRRT